MALYHAKIEMCSNWELNQTYIFVFIYSPTISERNSGYDDDIHDVVVYIICSAECFDFSLSLRHFTGFLDGKKFRS